MNKNAFSIFELILIIILISIITILFNFKKPVNKLELATNRLALYLKEVRYKALINDKYNKDDSLWHKKRWTLKFFRCSKKIGGIYYVIYSDKNETGHPSANESLQDPLTKKAIYSSNRCEIDNKYSKYTLLTQEYDIDKVSISCNSTSSLGQLSFGNDGKVYTKLSSYEGEYDEYELKEKCRIKLIDKDKNFREIEIVPKTGYLRVLNP